MPVLTTKRRALSLIEIIVAIAISTVVVLATFQNLSSRSDNAKQVSCRATRGSLQVQVDRFTAIYRRGPGNQLNELVTANLWTGPIPRCQSSGRTYTFRSGSVHCPVHGSGDD